MSGVTIVGALLNVSADLLDLVPPDRIKAGELPDGIALSALLVRSVSTIERLTLRRRGTVRVTERVAVTVRADSYRAQKAVIKLARDACAGFSGDAAGFLRVSVLNAGAGPDVIGPGNSFEQTQDLRVSFEEPI